MAAPIQHFDALSAIPGLRHGFLLRVPGVDVGTTDKPEVLRRLQIHHDESLIELGMGDWPLVSGEQVHSADIMVVTAENVDEVSASSVSGVDGFITNLEKVTLAIYVADCGAVFLADPVSKAIGVLHSGKKGTEGKITSNAIRLMNEHFGTRPEDLIIALAPCIRPPAYEIDFATDIVRQATEAGVPKNQVHDCGVCTSTDLDLFYSYRVEKGRTGRMLALMGWERFELPESDAARVTASAPAKINLSLRVLRRREDGFHEIETRMAPISLADELQFERNGSGGLQFSCTDPALPTDESNLVVKAVRLLEKRANQELHVKIALVKNVPSGAGLGGGSSDAATTFRVLNETFELGFTIDQLAEMAGELGSDIPFFLYESVCDCRGRGEQVEPIDLHLSLPILLFKPAFGVETPGAYKRWKDSKPLPGISYDPQILKGGETLVNDLERPVFEKHLILADMKHWLLEQPEVVAALMSGSGSTTFAVLTSEAEGDAVADRAKKEFGETLWAFAGKTLSKS